LYLTIQQIKTKGMVIANDADPKRAYMLVHQLKRLGSPAFLVTTHQGQVFPNLYFSPNNKTTTSSSSTSTSSIGAELPDEVREKGLEQVFFDRILCDVPCSGDGTLRKSPNVWMSWSPLSGQVTHEPKTK
jgi:16S rRNA C967 or C1407 C5-methylase (RsmB/RsmF family)